MNLEKVVVSFEFITTDGESQSKYGMAIQMPKNQGEMEESADKVGQLFYNTLEHYQLVPRTADDEFEEFLRRL